MGRVQDVAPGAGLGVGGDERQVLGRHHPCPQGLHVRPHVRHRAVRRRQLQDVLLPHGVSDQAAKVN